MSWECARPITAFRSSPTPTAELLARSGAQRYWLLWLPVLPLLAWAVVRTGGLERGYILVPLMAYTPYAAAGALLAAGVAIALRNWAAGLLGAVAVVCLLGAVLPRAFGGDAEIPAGALEVNVVTANVHIGKADPAALVGLVDIHHADILNVQELTPEFKRKLDRAGIRRRLPYAVISLPERTNGGGIYSRFPLRQIEPGAPFTFRMPRAVATLPGGRKLRIVDAHPYTPKPRLLSRWQEGLESLPVAGTGSPWLLAGDFNATLDHTQLRDVIDRGYRDAADATGNGLTPTWPKGRFFPPPVTIDHVLADRRIAIAGYAVDDLPGSDHRALYARLGVP